MFSVDTHTHIISPDTDRYPPAPLGGHRSEWSLDRPVDIEQLLREADAAEVDRLVLVQASTTYGFDNSYAADELARHPDRLTGVCSVDFLSPTVIDELEHWVGERGFSGVRIRAADGTTKVPTPGRGLDDERMLPVWNYLAEHRVPVCIQMHSKHAPLLAGILEAHPDLVVILDHGGRPRLDGGYPYPMLEELGQLSRFGRVTIKITPPFLQRVEREDGDPIPLVRRLMEEFGVDHVVWGSNFPASAGSLRELVARIASHLDWLDDDDLSQVMGGNASRLYGIGSTHPQPTQTS